MIPDPSPIQLVIASACIGIGALLQGSVGFGMALVAAPLLSLVDARLVPGPVLASALLLTLLVTWRDRRSIDVGGVKWAIVGRVPGTLVGAATIAALPAHTLAIVFGALVVVAVLLIAFGLPLTPRPRTLLLAGLLSGFMGTTASIGGPPVAVLYQRAAGPKVRGTLGGYFLLGATMSIAALAFVGRFGAREIGWSLWLAPGVLIGFALSFRVTRWLDAGRTRRAVLAVAGIAGVLVIVRQVVGL